MRLRLLLLLPLCGVPAWYAGRSMGARGQEVHASGHVIAVKGTTDPTPATELREETWESLRDLAPTAENRWRALALFERWAADDPRAAAKRLAALPEKGCRLWSGRGALEAFFKVWAARDMNAAWQATGSDPFKAARDTVAALRAELRPAEVALDESLSKEVRHFAKLKLAAADPATAVRLGLFDGSAIEAALLGAPDPVARWRELKQLDHTDWHLHRAIPRLAVNSREAALVIAREVLETASPEDYSARMIGQYLALSAANPEELKAAPVPEEQQYEWPHAMHSWDERVLRGILDQPPGAGEEQKQDRLIFAHAASELLARDPAALLPYLDRWERDGTLPDIHITSRAQARDASPEFAAQVRALIEAAPIQWQQRLTVATLAALEEFEPAFLISRIEQQSSAPAEDSANAIIAQRILTRWLQQDTPPAAAWLQDHPSAMDDRALESMTGTWVGHDPETASAWINSLPSGARKDAAIRGLVQTMTTHDPAAASVWAARLSTDAERAQVQQDIMAQWHIWEPEAQPAP